VSRPSRALAAVRPRLSRFALVALAATALSACHVQVDLSVKMGQDGSGAVVLSLVADADVVRDAPGLVADLRLDDLRAAGWTLDGPTPTAAGGVRLALAHRFATPAEADALIASLDGTRGPFTTLRVTRTRSASAVAATLSGSLRVVDGLSAFADNDLIATIGAAPYAGQLEAEQLDVGQAIGLTLHANLAGTVRTTTGTWNGRSLSWEVPTDGSTVDVATTSSISLVRPGPWRQVAATLHVLWLVWIGVSAVFVVWVASKRLQRRPRRVRSQRSPGTPRRTSPIDGHDDARDERREDDVDDVELDDGLSRLAFDDLTDDGLADDPNGGPSHRATPPA
jgi:hypothetical protein